LRLSYSNAAIPPPSRAKNTTNPPTKGPAATFEEDGLVSLPGRAELKMTVSVGDADGASVGLVVGPEVGPDVGPEVGVEVGPEVGPDVGPDVGVAEGPEVGPDVGLEVGPTVGPDVGTELGAREGVSEGILLGIPEGELEGFAVGDLDGFAVVGTFVGEMEGFAVVGGGVVVLMLFFELLILAEELVFALLILTDESFLELLILAEVLFLELLMLLAAGMTRTLFSALLLLAEELFLELLMLLAAGILKRGSSLSCLLDLAMPLAFLEAFLDNRRTVVDPSLACRACVGSIEANEVAVEEERVIAKVQKRARFFLVKVIMVLGCRRRMEVDYVDSEYNFVRLFTQHPVV
jgi:hypothetical protein